MIKKIIILFTIVFLFNNVLNANVKKVYDYNWFWFLYDCEKSINSKSYVYRPFFMRVVKEKSTFEASLMPIIYWKYKTSKKTDYRGFFGLFNSLNYTHNSGIHDYDAGFFPLFYYGSSIDRNDKYLTIWPFGGNMRGKIGFDKITTYLFPGVLLFFLYPPSGILTFKTGLYLFASLIPAFTEYEKGDYKAWGILWPLIQRGKSKKRDDFRILPFYSHNVKKNYYDNYSFLLIFNYSKMYFKNDVRYTFFFFPIFGMKWSDSGRISAYTVLWPFFSWGRDKKTGDNQINMPWPFVQLQDRKKPRIKKRIFFPFYGLYQYKNSETFFITPLYFRLTKNEPNYKSAYYINFLIIWYFKRDYKVTHKYYGNHWRFFKIWPLFQVEYNDLGDFSFNLLSLLPMRDRDGYEKLYQPFWTLFEYYKDRHGEKRIGFLFRTYFQRWSDDFFMMKIPFLVTYSGENKLIREISFLFSMFGYFNNESGKYLRLFWIPIDLKKDEDDIARDNKNKSKKRLFLHANREEDPGFYRNINYGLFSGNDFIIYRGRF